MTTEELLRNDIELVRGIRQLAENANKAIVILAKAILEMEGQTILQPDTRQALRLLTEITVQRETQQ